jgi:hypothetical protein
MLAEPGGTGLQTWMENRMPNATQPTTTRRLRGGSAGNLPSIPSTFELARDFNRCWRRIAEQDEIRTRAKAGSREYARADAV